MPRLTTRDYLKIRHLLAQVWGWDDGQDFATLPGHAQGDFHDYFAPTVPMPHRDATMHRKRMTVAFPFLPYKAGRAFEALRASLEYRPSQIVDRSRAESTRMLRAGGKLRAVRVAAISRPRIDAHYLAKALLQLVKEDDGTLMKKAQKLQARADKKRH